MKKLLTLLAAIGLVSSASAVSITWNISNIAFGGNTLKSDTGVTAYLVYLGNGGSLETSYDATAIESLASSAVDSVSGTNTKGAAQNTYALPAPSSGDFSDLNGDTYGLLLSYVNEGKTYYNLGSATFTVSGVADETSSLNQFKPAATTFSYGTKNDSATSVSPGGGWTAVPEPSTAALALAGLALLLKRRKA